jgi:hypothetical protein
LNKRAPPKKHLLKREVLKTRRRQPIAISFICIDSNPSKEYSMGVRGVHSTGVK